eukprot:s2427_g12.t2
MLIIIYILIYTDMNKLMMLLLRQEVLQRGCEAGRRACNQTLGIEQLRSPVFHGRKRYHLARAKVGRGHSDRAGAVHIRPLGSCYETVAASFHGNLLFYVSFFFTATRMPKPTLNAAQALQVQRLRRNDSESGTRGTRGTPGRCPHVYLHMMMKSQPLCRMTMLTDQEETLLSADEI